MKGSFGIPKSVAVPHFFAFSPSAHFLNETYCGRWLVACCQAHPIVCRCCNLVPKVEDCENDSRCHEDSHLVSPSPSFPRGPQWNLQLARPVADCGNAAPQPLSNRGGGLVRCQSPKLLFFVRSARRPCNEGAVAHFPTNWKKQKPRSTISRAASLCS